MRKKEKYLLIWNVILGGATMIVELGKLGKENGPKVVAVIKPFVEECKKLFSKNKKCSVNRNLIKEIG